MAPANAAPTPAPRPARRRHRPVLAQRPGCCATWGTCGTTPQRAGEAAWHRRARRGRAAARTLLRVAAAADVLKKHHSSTASMGGGGKNGGGRGGHGGGANGGRWGGGISTMLQELRWQNEQQQRLLRALECDGALVEEAERGHPVHRAWEGAGTKGGDDGGKGKGGGGWMRGAGYARGGGVKGKPGDWACTGCGAYPCFAKAVRCFRCRLQRSGGSEAPGRGSKGKGGGRLTADTGKTTYLGPIGASGNRPLLGGRGCGGKATDKPPTFRVPGASAAARAEEAMRVRGDAEGYVAASGRHAVRPGVHAAGVEQAPPRQQKPPVPTKNSWAELAEEEDEETGDAEMADAQATGGGGDEGQGGGDEDGGEERIDEDEEPSEGELKSRWLAHCAVVRRLEKDGQPLPPGLMANVKAQRDEAERKWRAARTPHPLHKRLRWAEADVRAAEAKEGCRRRELEEHLERVAARTKEIEDRLAVDEARTARKREALRKLQQEAGLAHRPAMESAARAAICGIGSDIAPTLSAIIERLGDGEEGIRCELQLLSTSLGRVESVLREATEWELERDQLRKQEGQRQQQQHPARFDIGDDEMDGEGYGHDDADGSGDGGSAHKSRRTGGSDAETCGNGPRWTQANVNAPWRKAAPSLEAVEDARRILQAAGYAQAEGNMCKGSGPTSAETNDLAVAERRRKEEAIRQQQEALQQQQLLRSDPERARAEEREREIREMLQKEEVRRHQEAAAQAAAANAANEAREKEERWAQMSPEERAQAIRLSEQQAAVGAHVFGTAGATHVAGLVQQSQAVGVAGSHDEDEIGQLMAMSAEDYARWEQENQGRM